MTALGLVTLLVVAVLWARESLLVPASLLAVVAGALLSGWFEQVTGLLVRVLTRWGSHLSAEVGGTALPWLLTGALVVVFVVGLLSGADRMTVVLGLVIAPLVATLPGEVGTAGGDLIAAMVDLWTRLVEHARGGLA